MAITKLWFIPTISDSYLAIENDQVYRKDRTGKTGGGVAFCVTL